MLNLLARLVGRLVLCALVGCIVAASQASAQHFDLSRMKGEFSITQPQGSNGNLKIWIQLPPWAITGSGYIPIQVRVTPVRGNRFKESGLLVVRVSGANLFDSTRYSAIEIPIVEGESEAKQEMLCNLIENNSLIFEGYFRGTPLAAQRSWGYSNRNSPVDSFRNLVLLSQNTAGLDPRRKSALKEMTESGQWYSKVNTFSAIDHSGVYGNINTLPANWLYLSGLDQITISMEDLAAVDASKLAVLNEFVLAGGHMYVTRARTLKQITALLPVDYDPAPEEPVDKTNQNISFLYSLSPADLDPPRLDFLDSMWDKFAKDSFMGGIPGQSYYRANTYYGRPVYTSLSDFATKMRDYSWSIGKALLDWKLDSPVRIASPLWDFEPSVTTGAADELREPVVLRYGLGQLTLDNRTRSEISMRIEDPSNLYNAPQTFNAADPYTSSVKRAQRFQYGVGDQFWDWLIPSVGRTPVIAFLGFIGLFVGVVTPGLMFWSTKHRRRIWLVLLMPLFALISTIGLFAYGTLKDGFGSKSRIRSLTFLDKEGHGVAWSRQAYFAGSVPNDGIQVSEKTQIAMMLPHSISELQFAEHVDRDHQQKYRGWLLPRSQTQFSLVHPVSELAMFGRDTTIDPVLQAPSIKNASQSKWTHALIVDGNKQLYRATDVEPGSVAKLEKVDIADAATFIGNAYQQQKLEPPADSPNSSQLSLGGVFQNAFYFRRFSATSIEMAEEEAWSRLVGLPGKYEKWTPHENTYILFIEQAPHVERCLSGSLESDSLHCIIGHW